MALRENQKNILEIKKQCKIFDFFHKFEEAAWVHRNCFFRHNSVHTQDVFKIPTYKALLRVELTILQVLVFSHHQPVKVGEICLKASSIHNSSSRLICNDNDGMCKVAVCSIFFIPLIISYAYSFLCKSISWI